MNSQAQAGFMACVRWNDVLGLLVEVRLYA